MPSPTTAYELIKASMRLVGITAPGETPTADEANDALDMLNDIVEEMSTQNLFVYGEAVETFPTVAGTATYTIGPAGTFNTVRPVRIADAYCTVSGLDYPIQIIGQTQYDDISLKTQQQQIIEQLLYINDYPLGRITLWPVPSAVVSLVLSTDRVLTQIASTATTISLPPAYVLYLKHALGILLCPEYGQSPSDVIVRTAMSTKAALKRANKGKNIARFDSMLCDVGPITYRNGA
jgi:hypothetical protein